MTWKITPSLYSAWDYYAHPLFDRTDEQESEARQEFIQALHHQSATVTDAIKRGRLFENMVQQAAETGGVSLPDDLDEKGNLLIDRDKGYGPCALFMGAQFKDGVFQVRDGRELPSGNYIYGVADVIMLNGIVDIKCVNDYSMGKYQKSIQHWAYMYIWQLKQFYYEICDGSARPFIEPYTWFDGAVGLLESRISEMICWINQDAELREIFAKEWSYDNGEQKNAIIPF